MDDKTLSYYEADAAALAARYESADLSAFHPLLLAACRPGGRALDIGCGSGRDVAFLRGRGVLAFGVDASPAMIDEARRLHPEVRDHVWVDALPELKSVGPDRYDAVLATAVWMHLPEGEIGPSAARIAALLLPGGALLVSVPAMVRGRPDDHRDERGRLFRPWAAEDLRGSFEPRGLRFDGAWRRPDVCGRNGLAWLTLKFRTGAGAP